MKSGINSAVFFDAPPDGASELAALLERSGVEFRREGERFSFLFASGGRRWQTVCDCRGARVLVYGIYPGAVADRRGAAEKCSEWNAGLVRGSFFLREGRLVFRTGAFLVEYTDAAERVASALEYNAAAMLRFWVPAAVLRDAEPVFGPEHAP